MRRRVTSAVTVGEDSRGTMLLEGRGRRLTPCQAGPPGRGREVPCPQHLLRAEAVGEDEVLHVHLDLAPLGHGKGSNRKNPPFQRASSAMTSSVWRRMTSRSAFSSTLPISTSTLPRRTGFPRLVLPRPGPP